METIQHDLESVGAGAQVVCSIGVLGSAISVAAAGSFGGVVGAALGALAGAFACYAGSGGNAGNYDAPDDSHSYAFGA